MKRSKAINILTDWQELSLKKQIGQMVVVRASGYLFDHQIRYPAWEPPTAKLKHWLETLNLGGVILLGGSAAELALRSQQLQSYSEIPLFIAADIEEGVGQRFSGATWFPPLMALGEIAKKDLNLAQDYAKEMGKVTAQEALEIGINWLLCPVVDVNNNPNNPVINVRAFADTPEVVSQLATAFIQGAKNYPVLTTAKHFPGHGDTDVDSHLNLPKLSHNYSRLKQIELPPFQAAIKADVDSIMTAHLIIEAWDKENPATLSKTILIDKLREELGFNGLIVTDALIMGGITEHFSAEEIAVKAVKAGSDILLMPEDPDLAINAILKAVEDGELTKERIAESVARIWQAKTKITEIIPPFLRGARGSEPPFLRGVGRIKSPFLRGVGRESNIAHPEAMQVVEKILQASIKKGGCLQIKPTKGRNLIIVDELLNCPYLERNNPAVTIPKQLGYELQLVEENSLSFAQKEQRMTILQVFLRGGAFRGSAGITPEAKKFYQELLQSGLLQGLIIYGSPYILDWFENQLKSLKSDLPWVFSYGQMPMSQQIATEALFNLPKDFGLNKGKFE